LDCLPAHLRHRYASDFRLADDGFHTGRVVASTKGRENCWDRWAAYVGPMGVDSYLQDTPFTIRVRLLSGFAGRVWTGYYGRGKQVQACSVSGAITAVGQAIALATNTNPTKIVGLDKLLPWLQQMLDGFRKADPPTTKQLPVEEDVPEYLVNLGHEPKAMELDRTISDLVMIAFYYLLRIGEYTTKAAWNDSKQTEEFKMGDITFFKKDKQGNLRTLPRDAPDDQIASADGATLKLDNQKNGWKGVCVYQKTNGDAIHCPVQALGHRYLHLRQHGAAKKTILSAYYYGGKRFDVTANHISAALKLAASALEYPIQKGISINRINTHSLRSGGANALALAGYSDTQIQKMGRWRGATFKEYVRNKLACFSMGMSKDMKQKFGFVSLLGNAFSDITNTCINADYAAPLLPAVL
jgi:hypothetical protein